MTGADPRETRLRWLMWAFTVLLAASVWGFGIWARLTEDAARVIDAVPYMVFAQLVVCVALLGVVIAIRRLGAAAPSP